MAKGARLTPDGELGVQMLQNFPRAAGDITRSH
jgi:hypothetical protein